MPKKSKKTTARSSRSYSKKTTLDTYPRKAMLAIILLILMGLAYIYVYYLKINPPTY